MSEAYKINRLPEEGAYSTRPGKGLITVEYEREAQPDEEALTDRDGKRKILRTVYMDPAQYNAYRRDDSAAYEPIVNRTKSLAFRQLSLMGRQGMAATTDALSASGRLVAAGYGFLLRAPENVEKGVRTSRLEVRKSLRATNEYLNAHQAVRNVGMTVGAILVAGMATYGAYSILDTNRAQEAFLAHIRAQAAKMPAGASQRQNYKASLENEVRQADYLSEDDRERAYKRIDFEFGRPNNASFAAR